MQHTSHIEISKSALQQNIKFIRSFLKKNTILSSVVKGDAYGHGINCFVPIAEECGVNHFSVFSTNEAQKVLEYSTGNPTILIMGMIEDQDLPWAIENEIEFFVFEASRLRHAISASKKLGKKAKIHLEIETGLNRTGFSKKELTSVLTNLQNQNIELKGICTHFAGAESISNYVRIKDQQKKFKEIYNWLITKGIKPKIRHTACSAASIRYPETQMDMVRIGIIQYGFWPNAETFIQYISPRKNKQNPLERVISWKSKVMSVKSVKAGEFISYGTSYLASKDMLIATVPIGYSHGYARSLSNLGHLLINDCRVNVIGLVNMNMLIVDADEVPNIKKGDDVIIIGYQGDLEVSVASFGELSNQLNYELLTRLHHDIPRIVVD